MPTPFSSANMLLSSSGVLTASMPESCMPTLMTTTLSTCHRTVSSCRSFHTDSVSTDDRERCSSCISSISAWMLHLALYHFRAERQEAAQLQDIMERCSSTFETSDYVIGKLLLADVQQFYNTLTCDGGMDITLLNQQVSGTLWEPRQQDQLYEGWYHHHRKKEGPVLFL